MKRQRQQVLTPLADRGPLRVMFVTCSMPVGGAETLLVQLIRGMDREKFEPELCCLKGLGPLGEVVARDTPAHSWLWRHKLDPTILFRLEKLFRRRKIDAVVTVGAGDKMFWGRLAASRAGVPVIASALHSTGWPDQVERLNRWLTHLTDAFIGVAERHGRYLVEGEGFPAEKVHVVPNGVDIRRFRFLPASRARLRGDLGIAADAPVCGVVAAHRPEKNLHLFLEAASRVKKKLPEARFIIVGDGPERASLEERATQLGLRSETFFLGTRKDIPQVLSALDLFALTSDNEANPVSILEAMCCGLPIVATNVGSIRDSVQEGFSGYLVEPGDVEGMTNAWLNALSDRRRGRQMGRVGRESVVNNSSLERMVEGYENLLAQIYESKCPVVASNDATVMENPLEAPAEDETITTDAALAETISDLVHEVGVEIAAPNEVNAESPESDAEELISPGG